MKKCEILQELPKCDAETGSEQMLLEKWHRQVARHRVATNLQFVKNTVSVEQDKTKLSKMRGMSVHCNYNYLQSIYIVLGIVSNLEMI